LRAPDLPRRGPALADPEADGGGARLAVRRGRGAARGGRAEGAPGEVSEPRDRDERRVLLGDRARHRRDPAAARARDVRLLARRRLVGAHPRAEAHRQALPAVGALRRARSPFAERRGVTLAEAAARADELAQAGDERAVADMRKEWADEVEGAARSTDY